MRRYLIFVMLLWVAGSVYAKDNNMQTVSIEAEDGLTLVGDFWTVEAEDAPAVLLLHMLGSNRGAWQPLVEPLLDAGYNVLAVDMRGHGETGGSRDWQAAETDTQLWLDWLREQDSVGAVSIIGGSIGSNMALIGCANDPECVTAIALSPGLDYAGVMPESAVVEGLAERPVLLVGSRRDGRVAADILQMATNAPGEVAVRLYTGRAHGTGLFNDQGEAFIHMLIDWLDEQQE